MTRKRSLGRMRHRLSIMTLTRTPDGGGGYSRADVVQGTIAARISTVSKMEANTYAQRQERVTHTAMIRTNAAIEQGVTVYWLNRGSIAPAPGATEVPNGRPLYVVAVEDADPDKRPGEFMHIILREGGNL